MNTMDRYLRVILIATVIFSIIMVALYLLTGSYPETLTTMWFTYMLGECGTMGLIKCAKELSLKQSKEDQAKKAMAAMTAAEVKSNGKGDSSK